MVMPLDCEHLEHTGSVVFSGGGKLSIWHGFPAFRIAFSHIWIVVPSGIYAVHRQRAMEVMRMKHIVESRRSVGKFCIKEKGKEGR